VGIAHQRIREFSAYRRLVSSRLRRANPLRHIAERRHRGEPGRGLVRPRACYLTEALWSHRI